MCLILITVLSVISFSVGAPTTSYITGNATCDNEMKLYADGVLIASHDKWSSAVAVNLPGSTQVIGIECVDFGVVAGIKAAFSNGISTDTTWKCSPTYKTGWNGPGFNDGSWQNAVKHSYSGWSSLPTELNGIADWIWTNGWIGGDRHVYCRKELPPVSTTTTESWTTTSYAQSGSYDCSDRNNPCNPLRKAGLFYYPHHVKNYFVQCSEHGQCYVMPCGATRVWSQESLTCVSTSVPWSPWYWGLRWGRRV